MEEAGKADDTEVIAALISIVGSNLYGYGSVRAAKPRDINLHIDWFQCSTGKQLGSNKPAPPEQRQMPPLYE